MKISFIIFGIVSALLVAAHSAQTQDSFWKKLLRITGVSATPSQMKSEDEEFPAGGQVWVVDVRMREPRPLIAESGFRSPVFSADNALVYAIKANGLWALPVRDGLPKKVVDIPAVTKLIGFDQDDPDKLCVLIGKGRSTAVHLLSLKTGQTTPVSHNPASREHRMLLSHLRGWERHYGETRVYPRKQSKPALIGDMEWHDIFVKRQNELPVNVSNSGGVNCGHPSLSSDGNMVAFIRQSAKTVD